MVPETSEVCYKEFVGEQLNPNNIRQKYVLFD